MRFKTGEYFLCPQCQSVHVWGKGGAFCRMTCFYKFIKHDSKYFENIGKAIDESNHLAMERMKELNA